MDGELKLFPEVSLAVPEKSIVLTMPSFTWRLLAELNQHLGHF